MNNISIGFVGMGNMGTAVYKGIFGDGAITVKTYDKFKTSENSESLESVVRNSKYILLCVKPQQVSEVLTEAAPFLTPDHVLVSICAGISANFIRAKTFEKLKVVRVMPNTPMMLEEGATAVSADESVSKQELDFVCSVFGKCSPVVEIIPHDKMNEIICINGSSPAFIYLFAKGFTDYAAEQGIDRESAAALFSQTLIGSAKMLCESGMSPDELISQVCSKGGTTIAGIEALQANGFEQAVKSACESCTKRAYELGE